MNSLLKAHANLNVEGTKIIVKKELCNILSEIFAFNRYEL